MLLSLYSESQVEEVFGSYVKKFDAGGDLGGFWGWKPFNLISISRSLVPLFGKKLCGRFEKINFFDDFCLFFRFKIEPKIMKNR